QTTILRDKVKKHLLFQIHKGNIQIGKTINLASLSRETGISVTPIREALSQLEQVGIINAVPNRGFVVARLTMDEARDLIHTIAQLEVLALEDVVFEDTDLERLLRWQQKLENVQTIGHGLKIRFEFHQALVGKYRNKVLLNVLDGLKLRLYFYEHDLVNELAFFEKMEQQTKAIVRAIQEDNLPTAVLILKMHWMSVLEYFERMLEVKKG
ncbi:MAG: GntR family transcriptional regulator, partial [Muricauda sp.]|nr:GntR family transcriptional regulator [Allomuricauda sp.]